MTKPSNVLNYPSNLEIVKKVDTVESNLNYSSRHQLRRDSFYHSTVFISIVTLFVLLGIWWFISFLQLVSPLFLPSPQAVWYRFKDLVSHGYLDKSLLNHTLSSLRRIFLALISAMVVAIPLGVAIGQYRVLRGVVDPLVEFYRPIPPLAYLPLIVIWFGIGELSKVLLIYLAIFAPIIIATANGVRSVDAKRILAAQTLGATKFQVILYITLPSALPQILTGIRIGLGVGWSTLVAAELIAATEGIGFMVQSASQLLQTDVVIIGILIIAIIAISLEMGLRALQHRLIPWGNHL